MKSPKSPKHHRRVSRIARIDGRLHVDWADRLIQVIIALAFLLASGGALVGTNPDLVPQSMLTPFGKMKRPYGMAPWQFASYIRACEKAHVSPQRISQTIGNAPASAGFHAQDGMAREDGYGYDYCAAIDLSVRGLDAVQIRRVLDSLTDAGYAPWYRAWKGNRHIHMVFVGYPMKRQLRAQVRDFFAGRTGLVGHARETFYRASPKQIARLQTLYKGRNS